MVKIKRALISVSDKTGLEGLARSLDKGFALNECLKWATAAAWANLHSPGAAFVKKALVSQLCTRVKVSRVVE